MAAFALVLVACASSNPPPADPLASDPHIGNAVPLARDAFAAERFQQAVLLYQRAMKRAYARDDIVAIRAIGYELALTYYRLHRDAQAIDLAMHTNSELQRRGERQSREITLVEAWARYRRGDNRGALLLTRQILAGTSTASGKPVALRASILVGYLAAARHDARALNAVLESFPAKVDATTAADLSELQGDLDRLQGDSVAAARHFLAAAKQRRSVGDVEGIARALGLAAEAIERAGKDPLRAANFYARAARSALTVSPPTVATADIERWAQSAYRIASQFEREDLQREAQGLLDRVGQLEKDESSD